MSAPPTPIAPPTGDYRFFELLADGSLGKEVGPFGDAESLRRAVSRLPPRVRGVLVRGTSVLSGRGDVSPARVASAKALVAARLGGAPKEAPKATRAADDKPTERPESALRVARPKPVPAGHCAGCGEPGPLHLTVCPHAPAALPASATRPPETHEETDVKRKTATKRKSAPTESPATTAPAERTTCDAEGCESPAGRVGDKTRPELASLCRLHRQRAYERAHHWKVDLAVAAATVRSGTTERPDGAAPSRKGQRPAKPAAKRKAIAPHPKPVAKAQRPASPDDVLVTELRALLDRFLALRPDEARVRAIVDERLLQVGRGLLGGAS